MASTSQINNSNSEPTLDGINYYANEYPDIGDLVLVKFDDENNAFLGSLIEYEGFRCIMNYQDIVKKKRINTWTKIVPIGKTLIVQVDDIDEKKKIAQVSMAYLVDRFEEKTSSKLSIEQTYAKTQEKLMEYFNENKMMERFIKSLCIVNNYEMKDIWTTIVYHIDTLRRDEEPIPSLWSYFINNIDDLDDWIEEYEIDKTIGDAIRELYDKRMKETPKKIVSKIGIISLSGVNSTRELISEVLSNIEYKYSFRYETAPYYIFESSTEDSSKESHAQFVKALERASQKSNQKIFIKTEFIGKI